jgi:hypothetical protein
MKKMDSMFAVFLVLQDNTGDVKITPVIRLVLATGWRALTFYFLFALSHAALDTTTILAPVNVLDLALHNIFPLKKTVLMSARNLVLEITTGSMNKRNVSALAQVIGLLLLKMVFVFVRSLVIQENSGWKIIATATRLALIH